MIAYDHLISSAETVSPPASSHDLVQDDLVDELGHRPDAAVAEREVHHAGVLAHPVGVVIQTVVEDRLVDRAIDVGSHAATRPPRPETIRGQALAIDHGRRGAVGDVRHVDGGVLISETVVIEIAERIGRVDASDSRWRSMGSPGQPPCFRDNPTARSGTMFRDF